MTATHTGGTIGRAITLGQRGAWLLELDMGSEVVRVSTEPLSVVSRVAGDEVSFAPGLVDFDAPITLDSLAVSVRGRSTRTWSEFRRSLGPLRGRRFVLRRWYPDQVLEDALVLLEGTIEQVGYADPGAPDTLRCTLSRSSRALSRVYPSSRMAVDADTWPGAGSSFIGQPYPVIFGAPGSRTKTSEGAVPQVATPGLLVTTDTLDKRLLVAGHHVEAAQVRVLKRGPNGSERATIAVVNELDGLGAPVATAQMVGAFTLAPTDADEYLVGWDRFTGWGRGLLHRGRVIEGLGDLLLWGAETLTTSRWDLAQLEGQRASLNRFTIDAYWNDPLVWEDWVQKNVLGVFPIEEIAGPRGRYYRAIVYETDARRIRATLATSGSGSGRRVERISGVDEGTGEIINSVEVSYQAYELTDAMRSRLSVGPRAGQVPMYSGLNLDTAASDFRAAASDTYFGERSTQLEVPQVWDPSTALLLAQALIGGSALPGRRAAYLGGPDLLDLAEYDTVELWDNSAGACFLGELAIVETITIVAAGVQLELYVPDDPLRRPLLQCDPTPPVVPGAPAPTLTEITELPPSTTLDDLKTTMSKWEFTVGLWTATANGSAAPGEEGFNDSDICTADLPMADVEPDWDPATHDLWVHLEIVSSTGSSDRWLGVSLVEVDGLVDTGHGIAFVDAATVQYGHQLQNAISIVETVAGITDLLVLIQFTSDGSRLTTFAKVSGSWLTVRTASHEDPATQTLDPADYVLRVSSGTRTTSTAGSITARVHRAAVERFSLP